MSLFKRHLTALIIFVFLTFLISFPLILKPASLTVKAGEEFLLSYIINWNVHALTTQPTQIFQTPFFYPIKDTLAFSDPLFTSSVIALPFIKIFQQPFLAYSFNIILSFILNGFAAYLLVFLLTKNWLASLVSGVLLTFSVGRLDTLEHLQVFSLYWTVFGLYFFLQFVRRKSLSYCLLTVLFFILQIFNTIFLGYAYVFIIGIFSLVLYLSKKFNKTQIKLLMKYFFLALLLVAMVFLPYLRVSRRWQYTRSFEDIWAGSAYFLDYFYPTHSSRLEDLARQLVIKQPWPAYMGAAISILLITALFYFIRHRKKNWPEKSIVLSSLLVAFGALIISLGPYLQIIRQKLDLPIPLPYFFAYYLIPGFKSMRVPQRWSHIAILGFSLFIGLILARFSRRLKPLSAKVLMILIIFLVILEIRLPLFSVPVAQLNQLPPVYHWLAEQEPSLVLELPAQTWVQPLTQAEINRLHYHSFFLDANHTFINGYSGFSPPNWEKLIYSFRQLPQDSAIGTLNDLNPNFIIVHHQEMIEFHLKDPETFTFAEIFDYFQASPDFIPVYTDDQTTVYQTALSV